MKNNFFLVLGSGSIGKIDAKCFDRIFCANTSFTRLKPGSNFSVVTSDAFLFNEEMLNSLPPIRGLPRKESNKIRLKKYSQYNNISPEKVFIFDGPIKLSNKHELINKKKFLFKDFSFVSYKDKWNLFINTFSLFEIIKIYSNIPGGTNKIKFIIQYIFKLNMSLIYRPSIGIFSIMLALKEDPANNQVFVEGITGSTNDSKYSYYGNTIVKFDKYSHYMDSFYYNIITKKFSIKRL